MTKAIGIVGEAYGLTTLPKADQVFNRSFLPPKADRTVKAMTN
jgi:NitT/TauT family transport system substrate-binding protein